MGRTLVASGTSVSNPFQEELPHFQCWALSVLRCELHPQNNGNWQVTLPEPLRNDWNGRETFFFSGASNGSAASNEARRSDEERSSEGEVTEVLEVSSTSNLFRWTLDQLQTQETWPDAAPADQPRSVHELTKTLFAPYSFPDGHIHLAGCTLENHAIVRLSVLRDDNGHTVVEHKYYWPTGERVTDELVTQLKLCELEAYAAHTPAATRKQLQGQVESLRTMLAEDGQEVVAIALVWCKHAQGKISFESGDKAVELPFEGWASLLAAEIEKPGPYHCPLTNCDSYTLGMTDKGDIVAAEGIAVCDDSGKKVLLSQVERCAATGKRVLKEKLQACQVSGESVLSTLIVACSQCGQRVSPNVVKGGRCSACRSLAPVRKDDPRMARLLDEYPRLDHWPRWRISETETAYVLLATSWLKQLSLVVDKESLEVSHIATSGRLLTNWQEVSASQREELLGA